MEVLSISTDTEFSHWMWKQTSPTIKFVDFPMASDPSGEVARAYGVCLKSNGLNKRGRFIIDPDGLIQEQGLGVVVSNVDELHDAVHKLVSDDRYWNEMSRRCRAFSKSNFDIHRTVDKFIDILNDADIRK